MACECHLWKREHASPISPRREDIDTRELLLTHSQPTMSTRPMLSILQYNVMKSRDRVMAALL
jgi:hypothetical protein